MIYLSYKNDLARHKIYLNKYSFLYLHDTLNGKVIIDDCHMSFT